MSKNRRFVHKDKDFNIIEVETVANYLLSYMRQRAFPVTDPCYTFADILTMQSRRKNLWMVDEIVSSLVEDVENDYVEIQRFSLGNVWVDDKKQRKPLVVAALKLLINDWKCVKKEGKFYTLV